MNGTSTLTQTIDYTFGHTQISQTTKQYDANGSVTSYAVRIFGHDGHGSVRVLTDMLGAVVQMYAFDAYGQMVALWNAIGQRISGGNGQYADAKLAVTNLLYSGEQCDTRIGQQYLRARYYDASTGRFNSLDPFYGNQVDPLSFHKYLYTQGNPVGGVDPTGQAEVTIAGLTVSINVHSYLATTFVSYAVSKAISAAIDVAADGELNSFQWFEWWDVLNFIPGAILTKSLSFVKYPVQYLARNPATGKIVSKLFLSGQHSSLKTAFSKAFPSGWTKWVPGINGGINYKLVAGNADEGFVHLIRRHLVHLYDGSKQSANAITSFWPTKTSPQMVINYLEEALYRVGVLRLQPNGLYKGTTTLLNGITCEVIGKKVGNEMLVHSFIPVAGPGVTTIQKIAAAVARGVIAIK